MSSAWSWHQPRQQPPAANMQRKHTHIRDSKQQRAATLVARSERHRRGRGKHVGARCNMVATPLSTPTRQRDLQALLARPRHESVQAGQAQQAVQATVPACRTCSGAIIMSSCDTTWWLCRCLWAIFSALLKCCLASARSSLATLAPLSCSSPAAAWYRQREP